MVTLSGAWIELHVSGASECLLSCTEAHVIFGTATLLLDEGNSIAIESAQVTVGHVSGHANAALHTEMRTGTANVRFGTAIVTLDVSAA